MSHSILNYKGNIFLKIKNDEFFFYLKNKMNLQSLYCKSQSNKFNEIVNKFFFFQYASKLDKLNY